MSIKRYECITDWGGTNFDATLTDDGPWVSYEDHAEEIATLRAKLRIFLRRRDSEWEEGDDLRAENERLLDEAYNARQSAKGENALRLDAERERDEAEERARFNARLAEGLPELVREQDTLRADVERWVKEVAHLKLAAEKAERERDAALKDTKRLDWACQESGMRLAVRGKQTAAWVLTVEATGNCDTLREAIDAAQEEQDDE